ncbi:urea transporter [Paraburkholderia sp. UYCP14C]|uniref:urea transporter n=1 Tax=Paraburkholderia sp. UYCP14C TaxID=2511130 RepID=UPI00101E9FED|nr:urea transporter [Paraburkholderia sp. UYCP14C]RZF27030.1 urea transporter [Paraburkholderia sp. UYCP14C]
MHAAATDAPSSSLSAPLRTLLRSLGQIVLQPNAVTGACMIGAWLLSEPRLVCAALLGAIAANISAMLAGSADADLRAGLLGFNGALAGLAAFSFIGDPATASAVAILAATGTAWLLRPWSRWLRTRGLGYLSSPCLIVTWLWLPLIARGPLPTAPATAHPVDALRFVSGVLAGVAQTGFASGAAPGVLVLLGIAAASRKHALYALAGAGLASAAHLWLGAGVPSFDAGLSGFNGALTALALADAGYAAMLGGIAMSVLLQAAAMHFGWPAMTAPFVLATWSIRSLGRRIA